MRRPFLRLLPCLAALLVTAPVMAGNGPSTSQHTPSNYQVPFEASTIDLPTSANGIDYRLYIRKPLRDPQAGEQVVTVYVLDALWKFPAAATMLANAEFLGHLPPLLLVGVGYRDDAQGGREENRTRDYTPTAFNPKTHAFMKPKDYQGSGGGEAFLQVLEKQVIPYVEATHQVDASRRLVVGKSMSGLAAAYALVAKPELFSDYLIISPALWWDDYFNPMEQRAIGRLEAKSHANRFAAPKKVFLVAGDGEEHLGVLADVQVFARSLRLRQDSQLELTTRVLANEVHETMFASGYVYGLSHLLGNRR